MSIKKCCSLCCNTCRLYKLLQNESSESNEIYQITVKYFDPMLLRGKISSNAEHNQVLCQDCWFHIEAFHQFEKTVLKTRMLWKDNTDMRKPLPLEIKQEDEELYVSTNCEEFIYSNENGDNDEDNDEPLLLEIKQEDEQPYLSTSYEEHIYSNENGDDEDEDEPLTLEIKQEDEQPYVRTNYEDEEHIYSNENSNEDEDEPQFEIDILDLKTESLTSYEVSTTTLEEENSIFETPTKSRRKKENRNKSSPSMDDTKKKGFNKEMGKESDAFIAEWKPELICDLCSETATNFEKLRRHFRKKHKTRFYIKCCWRKFVRRCVLVEHIKLHLNPETFKCDICGKSSSTKHNLKLHKKTVHEDERTYKCNYCNKAFKRPKVLREHIATHTGQDLYQCPHCPQTFKVSSNVHHHRKKAHPKEWEEGRKNRLKTPKVIINKIKNHVVL